MSRPVGRHRARRNTGIGALRRPAVAATAAISTVSVAAAAYSATATANATAAGTAQAKLLLGAPASTSTALRAANSGVAADGQAQAVAAQQAVSARKATDAKSESAAAARTAAAAKLQKAAKSSVAAAQKAATQKAAVEKTAAKKAAAKKAAAKKTAEAKRSTSSTTSRDSSRPPATAFSGSPQAYASSLLPSYGWDQSQMGCLVSLWNRESGWNASAMNASSGAYGIPQSLPGSKMASAGADWRTNPATQIRWGLGYIKSTYGSPCGAWGHSQATGWY